MDHVQCSVYVAAPAAEVWQVIGGFQALPDWHPAIAASAPERHDGVEHRRLTLADGAEIFERKLGEDGMSCAYEIVESPLPMEEYRSTLSVCPAGEGSVVCWASVFRPRDRGVTPAVRGIYQAGLDALRARFGG